MKLTTMDWVCIVFYVLLFIIVALILMTDLTGCAVTKPTPIAYKCPLIQLPPYPISQTRKLKKGSHANTVVQSYAADLGARIERDNIVDIEIRKINSAGKIK